MGKHGDANGFFGPISGDPIVDEFMSFILTHPEDDVLESRKITQTEPTPIGENDSSWRLPYAEDDYGISPQDYETEEEYLEAISAAENESWRLFCTENDFGINPEDYATEAEYNEAVLDAEIASW